GHSLSSSSARPTSPRDRCRSARAMLRKYEVCARSSLACRSPLRAASFCSRALPFSVKAAEILPRLISRATIPMATTTAVAATARREDHRPVPPCPLPYPLQQRRPLRPDRLVVEVTLQVVGQLLGRGVAVGRVLLQRLEDDGFQLRRDCPVTVTGPARFLEGD